jgi:BirA family biotin operon repressor/biotin-[acetyl-CoA-carboxylase] ligase
LSICLDATKVVPAIEAMKIATIICNMVKGTSIKWPNDIIFNNKKLSGILTEVKGDKLVIGVGINVKACEVKGTPRISLEEVESDIIDQDSFINSLLNKFSINKITIDDINSKQYFASNKIIFEGKECSFDGINNSGSMTIVSEDGTKKEVTSSTQIQNNVYL